MELTTASTSSSLNCITSSANTSSNSSSSSSSSSHSSSELQNDSPYFIDTPILEDYLFEDEIIPSSSSTSSSSIVNSNLFKNSFPDGLTFKILRWPLLLLIVFILALNLSLYFLVRQCVFLYERMFVWQGEKKKIRLKWLNATDYRSWKKAAVALDNYFGYTQWKQLEKCPYYDFKLIALVVKKLTMYETDAVKLKSICLESACKQNLGGVNHPKLYSHCYSGSKHLIQTYVKCTVRAIHVLNHSFDPMDRVNFFKKATHLYGRTALCLSGGASFGYYHLGVIKALLERRLLPSIVAGSSAGAMVAALCCCRTDEELMQLLHSDFHAHLIVFDESIWTLLKRRWETKAFFSPERWKQKLNWVTCGDLTFFEAYKKTGRILNITIMSTDHQLPATLLNYITAPDVLIGSAILASCAIPGMLPPIQLMYKPKGTSLELPFTGLGEKWLDGSLRTDIPSKALHSEFNVNFTIVSQANPHIHFFFFDSKGIVASTHRGWRGGFILAGLEHYLKLNLMKYLKLLRNLKLSIVGQQDWSSVFLQRFHGNVNIVPESLLLDFFYLFSNPSQERLNKYLLGGQRNTWPKIEMIKNRLRIEQALFKNYEKAKRTLKKGQQKRA